MTSFYEGKKVLITGMNGFVGGNIAQKLIQKNADVFGVDNDTKKPSLYHIEGLGEESTLIDADISDFQKMYDLVNDNKIEVIFHLAAEIEVGKSEKDPFLAFETNVKGTYNLCEIARRLPDQVKACVVASSDKAYGHYSEAEMPYQENYELKPKFAYETSKATGDMIAQSYARNLTPVPVVVTRFCNIYGPGQLNPTAIFPDFFVNILRGKEFKARSNGLMKRDFVFVEDVADLYLKIAEDLTLNPEKLRGEVFNYGTNKPIIIKDLVNKLIPHSGADLNVEDIFSGTDLVNSQTEIDIQFMDFQKVKQFFGHQPAVYLDEGIKRTAQWYQQHIASL